MAMLSREEEEPELDVAVDELAEGIEWAKREQVQRIRIRGFHLSGVPQDLSFEGLAGNNSIYSVSIADDVKVGKFDPSGLYEAENLCALKFLDRRIRIDLSRLPQLELLYARYSESLENLTVLEQLKELLVVSAGQQDCGFLRGLSQLQVLRLSGGKLRTLAGIETLTSLNRLDLGHLPQLEDSTAIAQLSTLTELSVERCRMLSDFSYLGTLPSLRKLFLSDVESLAFVRDSSSLEELLFWNLIDGDLDPLLDSTSLKKLSFHPNKRHYQMTLEAVLEHRQARQRGEQP